MAEAGKHKRGGRSRGKGVRGVTLGPCRPSFETRKILLIHSLEPSSERVQNVYLPLFRMTTVPEASHAKLPDLGVPGTACWKSFTLPRLIKLMRFLPMTSRSSVVGTRDMPPLLGPLSTLNSHPLCLLQCFGGLGFAL
jgi:hypothetical protein